MNELNKKLAEFARLQFFPECECIRVKGICWGEDERTHGVDGKHHFVLPRFTESTDACFTWLEPELYRRGLRYQLTRLQDGHRATIFKPSKTGWADIVADAVADKTALAFCKAVEILMEKQ